MTPTRLPASASQDSDVALPFNYEEFVRWFDEHFDRFDRARDNAHQALIALLNRDLPEPQRIRVRVEQGRVKGLQRTWRKLIAKYADRVTSLAEIPAVIDDLVGIRIVCTNHSDLRRVIDALDTLRNYDGTSAPVLERIPVSERNYLNEPKQSGYRAYHVNLCTAVNVGTDRHPVTCEVQVRTLLQNSWGELTHEDTYKPGGRVPPLVDTLSLRIADLMATLDDLAEDLRTELDRQQEVALEETPADQAEGDQALGTAEAAQKRLIELTSTLERPTPLASLAWELQTEFGQDITNGWFGYGNFKGLLLASVPDIRLSSEGPSYVLPAGFSLETYKPQDRELPAAIALLHDADQSFPLVDSDRWPILYAALAEATRALHWKGDADIRVVNELTRSARDRTIGTAAQLPRRPVNYVALALHFANKLTPNMSADEVEGEFVRWTTRRADALNLPREELANLDLWLRGGSAG